MSALTQDEMEEPNNVHQEAAADITVSSDEEEPQEEEKQWLALLPSITREMAGPTFTCFLKRAVAVLFSIDFSAPHLPSVMEGKAAKNPVSKLENISLGLVKMYHGAKDESQRKLLLSLIVQNKAFIYFVIQLTCKAIQLCGNAEFKLWLIPLVRFLELICMTLELCGESDVKIQLEKQQLLTKMMSQLNHLPVDVVQDLSEENVLLQTVLFCVKILFQCADNIRSQYVHKYSQALLLLLQSPNVTLRLITRALLLYITPEHGDSTHNVLRDDEINKLIDMLEKTKSLLPTDFSLQMLLKMMEYLTTAAENASILLQWGVLDLVSPLADSLTNDSEEQKILTEFVWKLMQFKNGCDFTAITTTVGSIEMNQGSSGSLDNHSDCLPKELVESISPSEAAVEFTELLLNFLMKTLLPYEGIPLEDGIEQLSDATWYTISECILLISWIISESDDHTKKEIICCAAALPGCCRSIQLAFYIGTIVRSEGLPKTVMSAAFDELMIVILTFSDDYRLAQEIARSGFVHIFTAFLTTGLRFGSLFQWFEMRLVGSLFILYNLSRDPTNYPAFFFSNSIDEIIPYTYTESSDLASNAKFILSFLHMYLDCDQLPALKFKEEELEKCINSLTTAINSLDFQANGMSVDEFLQILIGATHPSLQPASKKIPYVKCSPKKKAKSSKPKSSKAKSESVKLSYFDEKMLEVAEELVTNSLYLIESDLNVLSLLEGMLKKEQFQILACKFLWNLLHHESVRTNVSSNYPAICESLEAMKASKSPDVQLISHFSLWLLGACDKDPKSQLKYAQGCYEFGCYAEADAVCSELIEEITVDKEVKCKAKLLKGKAVFYGYQRKLMYYMTKKSELSKLDERKLISECFQSISETISHLGRALDDAYIDQEGSKLLDWAMIDCTRETNWLIRCNRCFLCRRFDRLCKSHVFPRFQLDQSDASKSIFAHGHDKHQLKSAKECWIWLCCRRCEGKMTQNAENDFSARFPSTGSVEYSSWLFNYCCTILFRTFACMKFPLTFNDNEIYQAFLYCRKHLLSLPVKIKNVDLTPTKMENHQLQLLSTAVTEEIKPFLFVLPNEVFFERSQGVLEQGMLNTNTLCFLSFRRLIDGHKDMARRPHFFVAYSKRIAILLPFSPSAQCLLPQSFSISSQNGTYTIPEEREAIKLIPKGLWELHHNCALEYFQSLTEALRQITPFAADKMILDGAFANISDLLEDFYSISEAVDEPGKGSEAPAEIQNKGDPESRALDSNSDVLTIPFQMSVDTPQISMLPPDFKINQSRFSSIKLSRGHQIVLHHVEDSSNLTVFLVVSDSGDFSLDKPYIIYLFENSGKTHSYVDAVFIEEVAGEIFFTNYLIEHSIYREMRDRLADIQEHARALVLPMLNKNQFLSLQMFMHYLKCYWFSRETANLPSLDIKCSSTDCWYCRDLCHCCMKPALWIKMNEKPQDVLTDKQLKFCSEKCNETFCIAPSVASKSMVVIDNRGKFSNQCPSVLGIVKVSKEEGNTHNTVEVINLCIGDGPETSESLPQGPYILWQVCSIDSQHFRNFSISEECIPTGVLWLHLFENEEAITNQEAYLKFQPHLSEVLEHSLRELGYGDLATYLKEFSNSVTKS